jgi:hypothetical protein
MTQYKIQAGATIETTTPKEVAELTKIAYSDSFQEMARGVKPMRFSGQGTVTGGSAVTIPAPQGGQLAMGPSEGFVWRVDRVSAYGLAAADSLAVHRTVADGSAFIGYIQGATGYLDVPEAPLLYGGEFLTVTGSALAATGVLLLNGEGVEVPSFALWKITT